MTKENDFSKSKMNKARTKKLRFVRSVKRECMLVRMGGNELERVKRVKVPAFNELNLNELARWTRGEIHLHR